MVTRAAVYCRISLDRTGEGSGVERQEEACRALCKARGWEVVAVEVDNSISASTGKRRPAWEKVLGMAERGQVDVVVCWALDRITRTMRELEWLIDMTDKTGVMVATVSGDIDLSTHTGRLVGRILAAVARAEVEMKGARQKAAHVQRRARGGHWWARRPIGYELDGTVREAEAERVRVAVDEFLGGRSMSSIARRWNAEGFTTTTGKEWRSNSASKSICDLRNAGIMVVNGVEFGKGSWPAIVDESKIRAAQAIRKDPQRTPWGLHGAGTGLLTGMVVCGDCGAQCGISYRYWKAAPGGKVRVYRCRNNGASQPADHLEGIVLRAARDTLEHPHMAAVWGESEDVDTKAMEAEAAIVRGKMKNLTQMYMGGALTDEQLAEGTAIARERLSALQSSMARLEAASLGATREEITEILNRGRDGDPERLRQVLKDLVGEVVIRSGGTGRKGERDDLISLPLLEERAPA